MENKLNRLSTKRVEAIIQMFGHEVQAEQVKNYLANAPLTATYAEALSNLVITASQWTRATEAAIRQGLTEMYAPYLTELYSPAKPTIEQLLAVEVIGNAFSDGDLWSALYTFADDTTNSIADRARAIRQMDKLTGENESDGFDDATLVKDYETMRDELLGPGVPELTIKPPPRALFPGEKWDLIAGDWRPLPQGSPSGTVRYLAEEDLGPCDTCGEPIVKGDLVDEDLVRGHSRCFNLEAPQPKTRLFMTVYVDNEADANATIELLKQGRKGFGTPSTAIKSLDWETSWEII
jgi:hypothetical protein